MRRPGTRFPPRAGGAKYVVFFTLALFLPALPSSAQELETVNLTARIVRVIDGDTVVAEFTNPPFGIDSRESVRLLGIDTPEMTAAGKGSPPEPFALEAKAYAESRLNGRTVTLYFETNLRDVFHRILAYIILEDGTMFNKEPLASGLARVYRNIPCVYQREFLNLERQAIIDRLGIWQGMKEGVRVTAVANNEQKEYVEVINLTGSPVQLKDWKLRDKKKNILLLTEPFTLEPGQAVRLHSGMPAPRTGREDVYLSRQSIWNNEGDTVILIDPSGRIADKYEY